jgi:hypothetical protein
MVLHGSLIGGGREIGDCLFLADVVVDIVVDGAAVGITDALQPAVAVVAVADITALSWYRLSRDKG